MKKRSLKSQFRILAFEVGAVLAVIIITIVVVLNYESADNQVPSKNEISHSENRPVVTQEVSSTTNVHSERRRRPEYAIFRAPSFAKEHSFNNETVLVWGGDHQYTDGLLQNETLSNIRSIDYAGASSCRTCHSENYKLWSEHAHRWMNAAADEQSVKGDFSAGKESQIKYRGGIGEFYRKNGDYFMKFTRDGVVREFKINRTLGSRVHQYYIGVLQKGPEGDEHALRTTDHVLPFGYELTLRQWVPIVHATGHTGPDVARDDPFETPSRLPYDSSCSMCHTTSPMGIMMLVKFRRFAAYSPRKIHYEGSNYIDEMHPGKIRLALGINERFTANNLKQHINDLSNQARKLVRRDNTLSLGISCEACHLGSRAHAENEKIRPPFFPSGQHVFASGSSTQDIWGKNAANKNFICARCHSGSRPLYAAGMATWNSTEYTDAMQGSCYDPAKAKSQGMHFLTCVSCHNPHETIGRSWTKSPAVDQESCVKCHTKFRDTAVEEAHTHHAVGSTGSQCMNCHMPKINEGLGDMVRTHAIFSPTNVKMLEANQPNACNMCHVEKSINWTLQYLEKWYGLSSRENSNNTTTKTYSDAAIDENYPYRDQSAAFGWLNSSHSSTRLVGADVLLKAKAHWALPRLLKTLDDNYMENRQFSVQRLRDFFDIDTKKFGYQHFMTSDERKAPIQKMLDELTPLVEDALQNDSTQ